MGMSLLTLTILIGAVYYLPPSSEDASRAVARGIADDRHGGDLTALGGQYPADVRLERCEADDARAVQTAHGIWRTFSGYNCVMLVSFEGGPDYKVEGFFHHDGADWSYYGLLRPSLVVETETFDQYRKGSRQTAKTGSILYNGGSGQARDPYQGILSWSDALLSPAEQPYHADIYSLDE